MKKTIQQLCVEYGCDKTPEIRHSYAPKYDELFSPLRDVKTVLEIGVGYPALMNRHVNLHPERVGRIYDYRTGVSLHVWKEYFPEATIYGIDIHPEAIVVGEDRIKTFTGDSTNDEWVSEVMKEIGLCDIIIDDGAHDARSQLKTAQLFIPYVKEGGMYFTEDVGSPNWLRRKLRTWNPELATDKKRDTLILIRR